MTAGSCNIFIVFTVYLSSIFLQSHGFEVIQPQNRTVNPDRSASIRCEHDANADSVADVRLNAISPTDKPRMLCQKGKKNCENTAMYQESPQQWLFVLLNIGPEAMTVKYECEVTVNEGDLDIQRKGTPTQLLPGQQEAACLLQPSPSPCPQAPHSPQLFWILIGLLALMFLCSCVISSFYIRLRCSNGEPENSTYVEMCSNGEPENSTYVEMRKAPRLRNPPL
ncbi:uncharacterized protein LOC117751007 isoform X2 [Cyclopterus lumpus]|uniref:uncharacterized protein LOC117751007 isoform X2 n=1 Tax=Cyclopterus lumpus TaxID=8103 RepID=UPI00148645FC|nr:uncharacterized protein LOC117751007 isoform X2 [Cyclopterus lumpus]